LDYRRNEGLYGAREKQQLSRKDMITLIQRDTRLALGHVALVYLRRAYTVQ